MSLFVLKTTGGWLPLDDIEFGSHIFCVTDSEIKACRYFYEQITFRDDGWPKKVICSRSDVGCHAYESLSEEQKNKAAKYWFDIDSHDKIYRFPVSEIMGMPSSC